MYNSSDSHIVAFVHAKGNSQRVPGKNLKVLGDKPLFCHAISNATHAKKIDTVVIDSDSDEILELGSQYGAIPLKRSKTMASNQTTGDDLAYWQASNFDQSKIVLQVVPTSPFIRPESLDQAISNLIENDVDSVVGVCEESFYRWEEGRPIYHNEDGSIPNSFDLPPIMFETSGLYINKTSFVLNSRKRLNPNSCLPFHLSKVEAIDINTLEDFRFAELVWHGMKSIDNG